MPSSESTSPFARPSSVGGPHLAGHVGRKAAWRSIVDVYRGLGIRVALMDARLSPVSLSGDAVAGDELDVQVRLRLAAAFATGRPVALAAGDIRAACMPIVFAGELSGGVVVSASRGGAPDDQLARAAALIARAFEDQYFESQDPMALTARRMATLYQLLQDAGDTGTERDVVQMFVDAVSVWEDAETFAFRGDLSGRFVLDVALAGADRTEVPYALEPAHAPTEPAVRLLTSDEKEQLGFRTFGETAWTTVAAAGVSWCFAFVSEPASLERLELYVATLRVALPSTLARESARLTWAMMQHLVEAQTPQAAAVRALGTVSAAVPAEIAIDVSHVNGRLSFSLGRPDRDARTDERSAALLRAMLDPAADLRATLELRPFEGRAFGHRELTLFDAAADTLRTWLTGAAVHLIQLRERRFHQPAFEQFVERWLRESTATEPVALILISPGHPKAPSHAVDAWIRHVRPQLRPTDLAAPLPTGDVAVLALDTPPDGALVVAQRLAQILASSGQPGEPVVRLGDLGAGNWSTDPLTIDRDSLRVVEPSPASR